MRDILELRVYYEDTDLSGRVYHASYLRFLERGRTEWLRARGLEHRGLSNSANVIFAVRGLEIEYLAPALMDDLLTIITMLAGARGAVVEFNQRILRGDKVLTEARVRVVALRGAKPVRPPKELFAPRSAPQSG
jgi:acyl-CoA thioester hydrolase